MDPPGRKLGLSKVHPFTPPHFLANIPARIPQVSTRFCQIRGELKVCQPPAVPHPSVRTHCEGRVEKVNQPDSTRKGGNGREEGRGSENLLSPASFPEQREQSRAFIGFQHATHLITNRTVSQKALAKVQVSYYKGVSKQVPHRTPLQKLHQE
ncbi:hypothetical protein B9Z19DRAFT_505444 [Tuber borchii]|uniref:Uncharacterized protein n=1 Tax=Tuber borchii TaxID=42251 RepID=A0A2T6ZEB9_TUBBO|nr:hypothetical protein B9Z19DRAFT_505444 [Tuber borchii]